MRNNTIPTCGTVFGKWCLNCCTAYTWYFDPSLVLYNIPEEVVHGVPVQGVLNSYPVTYGARPKQVMFWISTEPTTSDTHKIYDPTFPKAIDSITNKRTKQTNNLKKTTLGGQSLDLQNRTGHPRLPLLVFGALPLRYCVGACWFSWARLGAQILTNHQQIDPLSRLSFS